MTRTMTIEEYASRAGVSPWTVRAWARRGAHPFGVRFVRMNPDEMRKARWRVEVDVPVTGKEDDS